MCNFVEQMEVNILNEWFSFTLGMHRKKESSGSELKSNIQDLGRKVRACSYFLNSPVYRHVESLCTDTLGMTILHYILLRNWVRAAFHSCKSIPFFHSSCISRLKVRFREYIKPCREIVTSILIDSPQEVSPGGL